MKPPRTGNSLFQTPRIRIPNGTIWFRMEFSGILKNKTPPGPFFDPLQHKQASTNPYFTTNKSENSETQNEYRSALLGAKPGPEKRMSTSLGVCFGFCGGFSDIWFLAEFGHVLRIFSRNNPEIRIPREISARKRIKNFYLGIYFGILGLTGIFGTQSPRDPPSSNFRPSRAPNSKPPQKVAPNKRPLR